jgi:DNA-binding CsgD family transcriptional regulator
MSDKSLLNTQYSPRVSADLRKICEPLKNLGITYVACARIFNDFTSYFLSTDWDSTDHHFKNEYPIGRYIPESEAGKKFRYLPFLAKDTTRSELRALQDYRELFNISHPIYFIERHAQYTEIFCYATFAHNSEIINFYLANIDVLEKFKAFFKEKASRIMECVNTKRLNLTGKMHPSLSLDISLNFESEKNKILKEITPKNYTISFEGNDVSLTRRERDILKNLVRGCTIKETSNNLQLSPRTVEHYFNNIKMKMGKNHKSEVIQIISGLNII